MRRTQALTTALDCIGVLLDGSGLALTRRLGHSVDSEIERAVQKLERRSTRCPRPAPRRARRPR